MLPCIDDLAKVDLRTVTINIPPQEVSGNTFRIVEAFYLIPRVEIHSVVYVEKIPIQISNESKFSGKCITLSLLERYLHKQSLFHRHLTSILQYFVTKYFCHFITLRYM